MLELALASVGLFALALIQRIHLPSRFLQHTPSFKKQPNTLSVLLYTSHEVDRYPRRTCHPLGMLWLASTHVPCFGDSPASRTACLGVSACTWTHSAHTPSAQTWHRRIAWQRPPSRHPAQTALCRQPKCCRGWLYCRLQLGLVRALSRVLSVFA